jgi:hypothetical protein
VLTNLKYGDQIYIQKTSNVSSGVVYTITNTIIDNGTYCILPVIYLRNLGNFLLNNDECFFNASIVGKDGINGGSFGILSFKSTSSFGTQKTLDYVPLAISGTYPNSLNLTVTDIGTANPSKYFTGFVLNAIYRINIKIGIVHTTLSQNRVVRLAIRSSSITPVLTGTIIDSITTTVFGQPNGNFTNAWSLCLKNVIYECKSASDCIFATSTVDVGTVAIGSYTDCPCNFFIERIQ